MSRRRRRKESDFEALLRAPWQVSAGLAVAFLFITQIVVPVVLGANKIGAIMAPAVKTLGLYASIGFCIVALVVFFKQRASSAKLEIREEPRSVSSEQASWPPSSSPSAADRAWDDLLADSHNKITPDSPKPTHWTPELFRAIEWKRVEELVAAFFREKTFRTETLEFGADGGIDIKLFAGDKTEPFAVVQCKAWNTQKVGVKPVRELLGVMAHAKVAKGIFVTTGEFTQDAIAFAKENPITLLTGDMLYKGITALDQDAQKRLLDVATEGDYLTPTCASCGIKLVRRESKNGNFWGCLNYPRCRTRIFASVTANYE